MSAVEKKAALNKVANGVIIVPASVGRNNQRALRRMYRSFGAMRFAY
jgi:hypothetical protein